MYNFAEVLENIEQLPFEDRVTLNDILNNRIKEENREKIINTVLISRQEFENGKASIASVDEIINHIIQPAAKSKHATTSTLVIEGYEFKISSIESP